MPVAQYLNERGFNKFEGYCEEIRGQVADLKILVSNPAIKSIMEIGFNAGHSAELFLSTNPKSVLTSFDLGVHDYGKHAKDYIDLTYPLRHALELGDSTVVVPEYIKKNPGKTFDLIFIDGGHEYSIAKADMTNCRNLAHKDTILILDDTIYTPGWELSFTKGPTAVWLEFLKDGLITETTRKDYARGAGMSWGKYVV